MRNLAKAVLIPVLLAAAAPPRADDPAAAVRNSGVKGGVVVHLGCGDASGTAGMLLNKSYLVHGLDESAEKIDTARASLRSKGLYGPVTVSRYDGKTLPYADNTINLIVAASLGNVPKEEALRVLAPQGVLIAGGEKTVKPRPAEIDDWPQYLNKADNNAVAMDSVIGPPRRLQWKGDLMWCRSHMTISTSVSLVTANGRLFSIEDTAPVANPFLPCAFHLVARDAFNGKKLWTRRIARWDSNTIYIKCLPTQQQRRMAATGDVLYCTLEIEGNVSAVDAATGKVLKTYDNTGPCQEVAFDDGLLYLNVGDRFKSAAYNIVKTKGKDYGKGTPSEPFAGSGFRKGYAPEIKDKDKPRSVIMAVDPETGRAVWKTGELNHYTGASLAIKEGRAVYQTSEGLFCVDAKTGKEIWSKRKPIANPGGHDSNTPGTLPNTVILAGGKVFAVEGTSSAGKGSAPKNKVFAYALKDGRALWNGNAAANYESSSDVFFIDGALWVGGAGAPTCYDAETGKVLKTIKQKMNGPMSHDRCYRNLITRNYYINSKTGGADFIDLKRGTEFPHPWTRGSCGTGVLPANGLLYSTPYACTCSVGSMIPGLNAYASPPGLKKPDDPVPVKRSARLEKGPAYGKTGDAGPPAPGDWPAYRHDGFRSGITPERLPGKLAPAWTSKLPGLPTASTCADGKLFVAVPDLHVLHALDAKTGKIIWTFTTDGRIDSPPAYDKGRLLFGSRDGWVTCLRASDGALVWRFKDLPDRLICIRDRLESAWPVFSSVLVVNDRLHFAAGRSSFLDGGIFLYTLDPATGKLLNSRPVYGPFAQGSGFPTVGKGSTPNGGFRNGILSTDGTNLYLRHRAFDMELKDAGAGAPRIMHLSGFLDGELQYRTGFVLDTQFKWWHKGITDLMVTDGKTCYDVEGFPIYHNHSYFDPRTNAYKLRARTLGKQADPKPEKGKGKKRQPKSASTAFTWTTNLPVTGKALVKAGDTLFVAGEPMKFDDPSWKNYAAAYRGEKGGRLLAVSAADGKILQDLELGAAPAWDGISVADGRLYISLADGSVRCFTPGGKR